jgi:hypothetical protein
MSIENTIYDRLRTDPTLSSLLDRVYPCEPPVNPATMPYCYQTVTGEQSNTFTSGPSNLVNYTFTVDSWALKFEHLTPVLDAVKNLCHGWTGGQVQMCTQTSRSCDQQERGFHGQQSFSLWYGEANVEALPDSTGSIVTGPCSVTLTACENVLTLDEDGLQLNGEPVGEAPDLSPYARKDQANTFTVGTQTVQTGGTGTVGVVVRGASSQSAALTQWQSSGSTVLSYMDADGNFVVRNGGYVAAKDSGGTPRRVFFVDGADNYGARNEAFAGSAYYGCSDANNTTGVINLQTKGDNRHRVTADGTLVANPEGNLSASTTPVIVKGSTSQTANLTQWQDSTSTVKASVSKTGGVLAGGTGGAGVYVGPDASFDSYPGVWLGSNAASPGTSNYAFLTDGARIIFNAPSSQDINFRLANRTVITVGSTGNTTFNSGADNGTGVVTVAVKATASQTADVFQTQNSGGTVQFAVGPAGEIKTNQVSSASAVATVVGVFPVYDQSGTLLGYVPLYESSGGGGGG